MTEDKKKSPKDKYILFAFLGFFGVIFMVDGFFIHKALTTQTGVVSERAYEKGLEYNEILKEAKTQPTLNDKITFENNILRWDLNNQTIKNATVTAKIIRPIKEGHDFHVDLTSLDGNIYEVTLNLPFKGLWEAKLVSKWDNKGQWQTYKTTHQFIVK